MSKQPVSYRLSGDAIRLIAALAKKNGVSRTAVIEWLARAEAKRQGIK